LQKTVVEQVTVGQTRERVELREALEAVLRVLAIDCNGQYVRHALQEARIVLPEAPFGPRVRAQYPESPGRSEYRDLDPAANAQFQQRGFRKPLVLRQILDDQGLAVRQDELESPSG